MRADVKIKNIDVNHLYKCSEAAAKNAINVAFYREPSVSCVVSSYSIIYLDN